MFYSNAPLEKKKSCYESCRPHEEKVLADKALVIKRVPSHSNLVLQTRLTEQGEGRKVSVRMERNQRKPSWILIGCLFSISPRRRGIYEFYLLVPLWTNKTGWWDVTHTESFPSFLVFTLTFCSIC